MKPIEFDGEGEALVFAKDQPQYEPLPARVVPGPERIVHSRWELTDEERALVIAGAAIDLKCWTFGHPLQPVTLEVAEDSLDPRSQRFARAAAADLKRLEQQLLEGIGAGDVASVGILGDELDQPQVLRDRIVIDGGARSSDCA